MVYCHAFIVSVCSIMKIVVWQSLHTRVELGVKSNVREERL